MQRIVEERESVCDKGVAVNKSTTLHWMFPHPEAGTDACDEREHPPL